MANIESYVRPARLYRYRSLQNFERELDTIENAYLYCSDFAQLNDPMEGIFSSSQRLRQSEEHNGIRERIVQGKAMVGICSFSETRDHELMWAHYADQFRGMCVAYSFSKLLSYLPGEIGFVRMYYNETEPTIHGGYHNIDDLVRMVLSNKNYKWLYEREWRMFAKTGQVKYECPNCVTDVYLGSRVSDEYRNAVTERLSKLKIKVHDLTIKKYKIEFESCETAAPRNWRAD